VGFSRDELLLARTSPSAFGHVVSGGTRGLAGSYQTFEHLVLLNDLVLEAVDEQDCVLAGWKAVAEDRGVDEREARWLCAGGRHDRLVVTMPPRHGKSETTSRYLPAWYLGSRPDRKVILAAYEAHFAESWGRRARDLLEEHGREIFGVEVSQKSSAAKLWELAGRQGAMVAAGVGGPITGKGAELFLIDDPIKNSADAASQVMQENQFEWWQSTARTRLQKGAIVIIVLTRWHEADLVGRLLAHDEESDPELREGWQLLELPAIAEPDPDDPDYRDALGREDGEPLCPQLGFGRKWAARTRAAVGSYFWASMYQCRPRPAEGLLFKRRDFRYFAYQPPGEHAHHTDMGLFVLEGDDGERKPVAVNQCVFFQTADTAASEDEMADYSVISSWAVTPHRDLLLMHVERQRFDDSRVGSLVSASYRGEIDTPHMGGLLKQRPPVRVTVENASSGPKVIRELTVEGLPVASANADTDKVTRALLAVARYEIHCVYHLRGALWLREWETELLAFPNAAHDDQVDTVSYAAIELPKIAVGQRRQRRDKPKTQFGGLKDKQL
jgi:predicted phage terminase large subunit-like protein